MSPEFDRVGNQECMCSLRQIWIFINIGDVHLAVIQAVAVCSAQHPHGFMRKGWDINIPDKRLS